MFTPGPVTPKEEFYVRKTAEGNIKSISTFWGRFFSEGKRAAFLEKIGLGSVKTGNEAISQLGHATKQETDEASLKKLALIWAEAIMKGKDEEVAGQDSQITLIRNKIFSQPEVVAAYRKREKLPENASGEEIVTKMKKLEKQPISFRIAALKEMLVLTSNVTNKDKLVENLNSAMRNPEKAADTLAQTLMIVKYNHLVGWDEKEFVVKLVDMESPIEKSELPKLLEAIKDAGLPTIGDKVLEKYETLVAELKNFREGLQVEHITYDPVTVLSQGTLPLPPGIDRKLFERKACEIVMHEGREDQKNAIQEFMKKQGWRF